MVQLLSGVKLHRLCLFHRTVVILRGLWNILKWLALRMTTQTRGSCLKCVAVWTGSCSLCLDPCLYIAGRKGRFSLFVLSLSLSLSVSFSLSLHTSTEVWREYIGDTGWVLVWEVNYFFVLTNVSETIYMWSTSSIAAPDLLFVLSSMSAQLCTFGPYLGIDFSMQGYQLSFVTVQVPLEIL